MNKIIFIGVFIFSSITSFCQSKIPVNSASKHIGEMVIVCSTVYGVKSTEKVTYINLGSVYPNSPLTLIIFKSDLINFSDTPEKLYNNKSLCVTGTIKEYKGRAEIVISKQDQIKVE